jgi:hypothetical protein
MCFRHNFSIFHLETTKMHYLYYGGMHPVARTIKVWWLVGGGVWLVWYFVVIKKKLHGLSPRANYTDRATAACRRSDCQLLRIKGATWSA